MVIYYLNKKLLKIHLLRYEKSDDLQSHHCICYCTRLLSIPYKVVSTQFTSSTVVLGLSYTGQEDYHVKPTNPIIKDLTFTLTTYTFNDFDIKITDVKKSRF